MDGYLERCRWRHELFARLARIDANLIVRFVVGLVCTSSSPFLSNRYLNDAPDEVRTRVEQLIDTRRKPGADRSP